MKAARLKPKGRRTAPTAAGSRRQHERERAAAKKVAERARQRELDEQKRIEDETRDELAAIREAAAQ